MTGYKIFRAATAAEDGSVIAPENFKYEETMLNGNIPYMIDNLESAEKFRLTLQEKDNAGYYKIFEVSEKKEEPTSTQKKTTSTRKKVAK